MAQDALAEGLALDLPDDGTQAGHFETKIKPANSREERADGEHHATLLALARNRCSTINCVAGEGTVGLFCPIKTAT
jgi:hypothetical protein